MSTSIRSSLTAMRWISPLKIGPFAGSPNGHICIAFDCSSLLHAPCFPGFSNQLLNLSVQRLELPSIPLLVLLLVSFQGFQPLYLLRRPGSSCFPGLNRHFYFPRCVGAGLTMSVLKDMISSEKVFAF